MDYPIDSIVNIIFMLAHHKELDQAIFNELLLEQLIHKLKYASAQNLMDLVYSLMLMNRFEDENLWSAIYQ